MSELFSAEQARKCPVAGFAYASIALLAGAAGIYMNNPKEEQPLLGAAIVLFILFTLWFLSWDSRARRAAGTPSIDASGHLVARNPVQIFLICLLLSGCTITINLYGTKYMGSKTGTPPGQPPAPTETPPPTPMPSASGMAVDDKAEPRPAGPAPKMSAPSIARASQPPAGELSLTQKFFPGVGRILGTDQPAPVEPKPTPEPSQPAAAGTIWVLVGDKMRASHYDSDMRALAAFDSLAEVQRAKEGRQAFSTTGLSARSCAPQQSIEACTPRSPLPGRHQATDFKVAANGGVWVQID